MRRIIPIPFDVKFRYTAAMPRPPAKVVLTLLLCASSLAHAVDFTGWLGRRGWERVPGVATGLEQVIEDRTGRRFVIYPALPGDRGAALAASVLAKALGVPTIPVFPALAAASASGLEPIGESTVPDALAAALVRPVVVEEAVGPDRRYHGGQFGELAVGLLLHYVLGSASPPRFDGPSATFAVIDGHVVSRRFIVPFAANLPSPPQHFAETFAFFPWKAFAEAKWSDRDAAFEAMNLFLSRLEKLDEDAWARLTGPYAAHASGRGGRLAGLRERAKTAREFAAAAFAKASGTEAAELRTAKEVDAPIVGLPPTAVAVTAESATIDLLWDLWLHAENAERKAAVVQATLKKYPNRKGGDGTVATTEPNALATLQDGTFHDMSRIYAVVPHRSPRFLDRGTDRIPQLTLWHGNLDTLVVVPLNDPEAELIYAMAQESGARVLGLSLRHGSKLDEELRDRILAAYHERPFRRVAVVELPGRPIAVEQSLAADGRFRFFPVDHHDYQTDKIFRHRAVGSAEQVADLLGFELSPTDLAIALYDRSFVLGVLEAGFSHASLGQIVPPIPPEIERAGAGIGTSYGALYLLDSFGGKIPDAAAGISYRDRRVGNLFIVESTQIRFSGHPAIERMLTEAFGALPIAGPPEHYAFGDSSRSRGWGYKGIPKQGRDLAFRTLQEVFQKFAGPEGLEALAAVLGQPMDLEHLGVDARFRLSDGRRRAAALAALPWATLAQGDRVRTVALGLATLKQADDPTALQALLGPVSIPKFTSYDWGALVDLAAATRDPRWRPFLEACREAWRFGILRWHGPLCARAAAALAHLRPATGGSDGADCRQDLGK